MTIFKNILQNKFGKTLFFLAFAILLAVPVNGTQAQEVCNPNTDLQHLLPDGSTEVFQRGLGIFDAPSLINHSAGGTATVRVKNVSTNPDCVYSVGLASYKTFDSWDDPEFLLNQIRYAQDIENGANALAPGDTNNFSVSLPRNPICNYQVDLFEFDPNLVSGAPATNPDFANLSAYSILSWDFEFNSGSCATEVPETTLKLVKHVTNNNGGTAEVSDFGLFVGNTQVASGVTNVVDPGTYTVHEDNLPGYSAGPWTGDCSANGSVTLNEGDNKVCHITNDDIGVPPGETTLTLVKHVTNNNGGTKQVSDFKLYINNTRVTSGVANPLNPGVYTVHEDNLPGYSAGPWTGDCSANGSVTLNEGDNKVCHITNDDIGTPQGNSSVTLVKLVVNDNGGTAQVSDFRLFVGNTEVQSANPLIVNPGTYNVREINLPGYTAGDWFGDCSTNGVVSVSQGQHRICYIQNNDNPTTDNDAKLTVIKRVINDDGGNAQVSDFRLFVTQQTKRGFLNFVKGVISPGPTPSEPIEVLSGVPVDLPPGDYTVSEVNLPGYTAGTWKLDCAADGSITLQAGDNKRCRITNNDNPINEDLARLTLIKEVINDNDGQAEPEDFELFVITDLNGPNSGTPVRYDFETGVAQDIPAGSYIAKEVSLPGYIAGQWEMDCAADGSITLNPDDEKVCKIINNDDPNVSLLTDVSITKLVDGQKTSQGDLGQTFVYTLSYANNGILPAKNTTITDIPDPSGILADYIITKQPEHGSCTVVSDGIISSGITCNLGELPDKVSAEESGELYSGTIEYTAKGLPQITGTVVNTAIIETTTPETTYSNNEDTATIIISTSQCVIPVISNPNPDNVTGQVGNLFSYTINVFGSTSTSTVDIAITSGSLPSGLILNGNVIEGTPTQEGVFTVTVTASNECGSDEFVVNIIIGNTQCVPAKVTNSNLDITLVLGQSLDYTIQTIGNPTPTVTVSTLPSDYTFDGVNRITGIATQIGTYSIQLTADNECNIDRVTLVIHVIKTPPPPPGCVQNCGGGGPSGPPVVLFQSPSETPLASQSFVYLNQVPYTGVTAGLGTALFTLFLLAIAGVTAYVVIGKKLLNLSFVTNYFSREQRIETNVSKAKIVEEKTVTESYVEDAPIVETDYEDISFPEIKAQSSNTLVKVEDATVSDAEIKRELNNMSQEAGVSIEDGGLKLITLAANSKIDRARYITEQILKVAKDKSIQKRDGLSLTTTEVKEILFSTYMTMIPIFVQWIAEGDSKKIYSLLRTLNQQGHSLKDFMGQVLIELDNVYRYRLEGEGHADEHSLYVTNNWRNEDMQEILGVLTNICDESYRSDLVSTKLAVTRILNVVKRNSKETTLEYSRY
jgi:uncharacterized repeat protein (TIGR01451 family)